LAQALKDADVEVRYYAAKSLATVGSDAAEAVPEIIEALKVGENEKLHGYLLKSLRKIGPKAKSAVPLLKELAGKSDEAFRKEVTAALASIEEPDGA
jgi:HEAT repeat protein